VRERERIYSPFFIVQALRPPTMVAGALQARCMRASTDADLLFVDMAVPPKFFSSAIVPTLAADVTGTAAPTPIASWRSYCDPSLDFANAKTTTLSTISDAFIALTSPQPYSSAHAKNPRSPPIETSFDDNSADKDVNRPVAVVRDVPHHERNRTTKLKKSTAKTSGQLQYT